MTSIEARRRNANRRRRLNGVQNTSTAARTCSHNYSSAVLPILALAFFAGESTFQNFQGASAFVPRSTTTNTDAFAIGNEQRSMGSLQIQKQTPPTLLSMVASPQVPTNETIHYDDNSKHDNSLLSDLRALGWDVHFANQLSIGTENNDQGLIPVRVTELRSKSIHVVGPNGIDHLIPVTQGQKIINENDEKVVVAGDWILVQEDDDENDNGETSRTLRIRKVLNRRSVIKRKAPGRNIRKKQLIASNLNTVFVVSSCNQDFNVARLERYIAMVLETENVEPVVVLTKKDLVLDMGDMDMDDMDMDDKEDFDDEDEDDFDEDDDMDDFDPLDEYDEGDASSWLLDFYLGEAGAIAGGTIPVVCLDARNGTEASELLKPWLGEGQTVAFVGSSGVGKSTLVNSLCGFELVKTGDIHTDSGQGRHTTTRRQLHFLKPNNQDSCAILDTPGLRELQLVDAAQGLGEVFKDLVDLAKQCKFNDCTHSGEPGCAIDSAVESGAIDADRVARWEKLVREDALKTKDVEEGRIERERKKNRKKKSSVAAKKPRRGVTELPEDV